jgi:pimeloyl-ACP methyl ester carboxylesterase
LEFKFTEVMGYRVRYAESGRATKNVLLVHGLGGSALSWVYNTGELSKHFHVLAPDLIGFGESEKPTIRYSPAMFTKFLREFMDGAGIRRASLVGSSMGGQVAAEFAINHPNLVEKLVLISPAGIPPKSFKGTKELKMYVRIFDTKSLGEVRKILGLIDADQSSVTDEYVKSIYHYRMMEGARHAFLSSLSESAGAPRLANRLRSIRASTLAIWGRDDRMIPVRYCEPFIGMTNCRLVILENCGHRPHAEKPETFNKLVVDFLREP